MTRYLVISVRFLDDRYHGQTALGQKAEWPPSPFRLFQALIAGNASQPTLSAELDSALAWLEGLRPPTIVAPTATEGLERLTYVINNYSDKDAKSRAPKTIRPMLMNGDRLVQYAWPFDDTESDATKHASAVVAAAKRIRCLGWGIDLAVGTGAICDAVPPAAVSRQEFRPTGFDAKKGVDLRAPMVGSLMSLKRNYVDYIKRYRTPEVTRMEAAALYEPVLYVSSDARPCAAFRLIDPDAGTPRSFPATRAVTVAGMIRGAVGKLPRDVKHNDAWFSSYVCGHHDGPDAFPRFSYLPLPSLQPVVGVGRISRVLIAEPIDSDGREIAWLKPRLAGALANNEQGRHALLVPLPRRDNVLQQYIGPAHSWTTVTPVALPGSDDGKPAKTARLIEKIFRHAGYSLDAVEELEYHRVAFRRGAEDAKRYRPAGSHYLAGCTMYHMRLRWKFPMGGPLALGSGRHCGLGIFALAE